MSPEKKISIVNILFLISIGISALLSVLPLHFLADHLIINILLSQGILIGPFAIYFIVNKLNPLKEIRFHKMKFSNIMLTILFGLLIQPVLSLVNALSLVFTTNAMSSTIFGLSNQLPWSLAIILVALMPAVFEETVFRGVLCQTYRKANPWKAVLMSGFLFGLMHGNLNQFSYAFVMGVIFALLIEATGSILSTMIIHFMINAISTSTVYLYPKAYDALKEAYSLYGDLGLTEMQDYITAIIGDMSMTAEEWVNATLMETQNLHLSFGAVLISFLPQALMFGILAFLVFKKLAKRCGNWNKFCITYLGADNVVINEPKDPYSTEINTNETDGIPGVKIVTVPLMIAIAIGVVLMFVYETMKLLPN